MRHLNLIWLFVLAAGCSQSTGSEEEALKHWKSRHGYRLHPDASAPSDAGTTPTDDASTTTTDAGTTPDASTTADSGTTPVDSGTTPVDSGTTPVDSGSSSSFIPSGWLYTQGNHVYQSNGSSGSVWVGRGVNADDIYLCGYNYTLWMGSSAESTLSGEMSGLLTNWKPTFVRVSLGMNSFTQAPSSWISGNAANYKTPMTNVVNQLGANPGTYVLVTLRSDTSMSMPIDEATYIPTAATDPVYQALVDSFANDKYVLFGVANEPGGNALTNAQIRSAMDHAVSVIRAEEDKLGVPHHIVSVQGNSWTSDISFYATNPLPYDNVVYEVHGYPPPASSYTYSNLPVIIGEYGSLTSSSAFYADIESKQIPSLAWDFESYSNCAPDLLDVNLSSTSLVPTAWGQTVQTYLLAH